MEITISIQYVEGVLTMKNLIVSSQTAAVAPAPAFREELFESWIAYIDGSAKTVETYTKSIKQFMLYAADNNITHPSREDIIAYREYLKLTRKPTTVQSYLEAVKLFFKWTEQSGLYPNIADHIKGAKIDREHKKDYLTTSQSLKLLEGVDRSHLKGKRDYAVLALMITTGLRTISVINADIKDIRAAGDDTVLYYKGKGHDDKAVYVKIAEPVEAAIREYLAARREKDSTKPLFTSVAHRNTGERLTTRSISRIVKDHLKGVGLDSDRLTAHSLRHTAATLNLMNGGTLEETQQMLDHTSINTTMIYSQHLKRANNNSEKRVAAAIFG